MSEWPTVELGDIERLRVLSRVLPGVWMQERVIDAPAEQRSAMLKTRDLFGFWQGLLRVVGSFGDCPRCLAVCPVGNDYHAHLAEVQKVIPERTPEKTLIQKTWQQARKSGAEIPGLSEWNARWVGPEGYKGMVAKQLQDFKKRQKELSGDIPETADSSGD